MLRAPIQSMQLLFVLCALVLCIRESAQPARKSGRAEIETQESREPFFIWGVEVAPSGRCRGAVSSATYHLSLIIF